MKGFLEQGIGGSPRPYPSFLPHALSIYETNALEWTFHQYQEFHILCVYFTSYTCLFFIMCFRMSTAARIDLLSLWTTLQIYNP